MGSSGIADFNSYADPNSISYDPQFKATWDAIESHLNQEAAITGQVNAAVGGAISPVLDQAGNVINSGGAALQGTIDQAKVAFASSFNDILQSPAISSAVGTVGTIYDSAKQYVLLGQSIAGAATTIGGILEHATGDPIANLKKLQAFTGTMIGALSTIGAATGVATAGIGAAVCAFVAVAVDIVSSLIGTPPPAPAGGYSFYAGLPFDQKPDWTVGGLGAWGQQNAPNAPTWRPFPEPGNADDAAWFNVSTNVFGVSGGVEYVSPGTWKGAYFGWGSPGNANLGAPPDARLSPDISNVGSPGARPIDYAFPYTNPDGEPLAPWSLYTIACQIGAGFTAPGACPGMPSDVVGKLTQGFASAWKANAAFALNGLNMQPDWVVLVHLLRMWNRMHTGPMVAIPSIEATGLSMTGSDPSPGAYLGQLVSYAIHHGTGDLLFGSGLGVNVGDPHPIAPLGSSDAGVVQLALPGASSGGMSTGTKVAVGAAVVGGAALLGTAGYATWKGVSLGTLLKGIFVR